MERPNSGPSAGRSRNALVFLGALYVALSVGYPLLPTVGETSLGVDLVMVVLVGGPGAVLFYGGYRLPRTDIRPELFSVILTWCLGGIGAMLGLLALTWLAAGLRDPIQNVLILTAIGGVAGFAAGSYDARAKTRELELQETVDRLRTANERLEQFSYAASHDLQEPLRMISSYLQLLDARYGNELDEDATEFIDFAVTSSDRMRAMIESLLEYSRVSTRGAPLEPTEAEAILDAVLDDLRPQIEETGATITTDDDLPTVLGDARQLERVFYNLLSNALKYSGGSPPRVHVGVERVDEAWRFSVADEGIGIDPQYHDRIFEVFEGLHAGDDEPEPVAAGIGLALCERIVERHGGEIRVDSESGEGATFSFTVPAVGDERA